MTGAELIPAVREEDATGETAAIFADLRQTLAVPFVNLIWRHLATIPGGLAPTWATLKPLYASGTLRRHQPRLQEAIALRDIAPVAEHVWTCAGVGPAERQQIAALIDGYNSANGLNFLALLVAVALLRGDVAGGHQSAPSGPGETERPAARESDVPRLPDLSELSPAVLQVVRDLDGYGRLGDSAAIASLYRHLAYWPAFLAVAHVALGPAHRSGALRAAQERVVATGRGLAVELAPGVPALPQLLGDDARERVLASLDEFTRLMIGRMIVMGHALSSLLPTRPAAEQDGTR